jgi:hypothetical protein
MNIEKIIVVGGGSAGWMTAATLIRSFPNKKISLIESKDIPIVGVGESTIGGIRTWARYIGLDEKIFFPYTDASLKLSIKFTDFHKKDGGSFHYPFGNPMVDGDRNPFWDWHVKKYFYPDTPVEDFVRCLFPSSVLFENNKFSLNEYGQFDNFDPYQDIAYHFDAVKFGQWLKEYYCLPKGVQHIIGNIANIETNDSGVSKLILDNGQEFTADLYIDCTGWKSLLLSESLKEPFESYADMLPNNKAWAARVPYKNKSVELEGFTNCTAIENGWCWNIPLWSRLGTGYVYSDKFTTKESALTEFKNYLQSSKMIVPRSKNEVEELEYKELTMRVGIHSRTFVKNVVAIGLAAGFIEPLESNGLFSVHEFLLKLVDILQRESINQFDRDMYNNSVRDLFDNFAKFVALHYALSRRTDTDYWLDISKKTFTDKHNDPYFPYLGRTDAFYNLTERYMENWNHPLGRAGIPYISTGLGLYLMNDRRIQDIEYRYNRDLNKEITEINNIWNARKYKWNQAVKNELSLEDFLKKHFYNE